MNPLGPDEPARGAFGFVAVDLCRWSVEATVYHFVQWWQLRPSLLVRQLLLFSGYQIWPQLPAGGLDIDQSRYQWSCR